MRVSTIAMLVLLAIVVVIDLVGTFAPVPQAPSAADVRAALVGGAPIDSPPETRVPDHDPERHESGVGAPLPEVDGARVIDFELIAGFDAPRVATEAVAAVPAQIRELDGTRVALAGYMVPTEFADGRVSRYLLARSPLACCYGAQPAPNELVDVLLPDGTTVEHEFFLPVVVVGTFRIVRPELGVTDLYGLYELDQESLRVLGSAGNR